MKLPGVIRPIFFLVLAGHVALLAIPISGSSDEIVPAPDPEGDSITVTRIPAKGEPAGVTVTNQRLPGQRATRPQPTTVAVQPAGTTAKSNQAATGNGAAQQQNGGSDGQTSSDDAQGSNTANSVGSDSTPDSDLPNLPDRPPATPPGSASADGGAENGETPLIAALQAGVREGGNVQALSDLIQSFSTALTFNNIQTRPEDETKAIEDWLALLQDQTGRANLIKQELETPLKIAYPLEDAIGFDPDEWAYNRDFVGCLSQIPESATVGLYFNQNGELAEDPVLLKSSGYEVLNAEALARAKQLDSLPILRAGRAFTLPVEIDYNSDACWDVDASLSQGS